jgi:hypothetical protein
MVEAATEAAAVAVAEAAAVAVAEAGAAATVTPAARTTAAIPQRNNVLDTSFTFPVRRRTDVFDNRPLHPRSIA